MSLLAAGLRSPWVLPELVAVQQRSTATLPAPTDCQQPSMADWPAHRTAMVVRPIVRDEEVRTPSATAIVKLTVHEQLQDQA